MAQKKKRASTTLAIMRRVQAEIDEIRAEAQDAESHGERHTAEDLREDAKSLKSAWGYREYDFLYTDGGLTKTDVLALIKHDAKNPKSEMYNASPAQIKATYTKATKRKPRKR